MKTFECECGLTLSEREQFLVWFDKFKDLGRRYDILIFESAGDQYKEWFFDEGDTPESSIRAIRDGYPPEILLTEAEV